MLVLFDIDGTLTGTTGCDIKCFSAAFEQAFGVSLPSTDWTTYRHVTDSGIVGEALEGHRGKPASLEDVQRFEEIFAAGLQAEFETNPSAFAEVPGAKALLEALRARSVRVALASGGMRRTALYKLQCAGMDGASLPGAFANDHVTREGIARRAIERAGGSNGDVVYVGDGLWDVKTSAAVGMRFIGITRESCPDRLTRAGATVCIEDFRDPSTFEEALRRAEVPKLR